MAPTLFRIGPLAVQGYGFMVATGLMLCWLLLRHEGKRKHLDAIAADIPSLYLWMLAAGYVGGKLFYLWTSPEEAEAIKRESGALALVGTGFVFYGSLIFCLPTLWWWLKKRSLPILPSIDVVILAAPVMLGTGRIGCFLAGCCHGCRYDGPLAVTFHSGKGLQDVPIHPAQLYETFGCYLVFAILWFFVRKKPRFDGAVAAWYFVLYGIERFVVEWFRGDTARSFLFGGETLKVGDPPTGVSFSQGVSILIVAAGIAWLWAARHKRPMVIRPRRA